MWDIDYTHGCARNDRGSNVAASDLMHKPCHHDDHVEKRWSPERIDRERILQSEYRTGCGQAMSKAHSLKLTYAYPMRVVAGVHR
jgi:hypothetical protein